MAGARADVYTSLLASVDSKAAPNQTPDTTLLQKGTYPTDVIASSDAVTTTVGAPPFTFGVALFAQSQFGA